MGKQFAKIEPEHRAFIERQKIFFVASAPPKGRVNVSPKGLSSFRILGENNVAYLDCTGSGSETRAHLMASDDKRLTIMFCAFEGDPVILRLYGQGQSLMRGTPSTPPCFRTSRRLRGPVRSCASPSISFRHRAAWACLFSITKRSEAASFAIGQHRAWTISGNTGASKTQKVSTVCRRDFPRTAWPRRVDAICACTFESCQRV